MRLVKCYAHKMQNMTIKSMVNDLKHKMFNNFRIILRLPMIIYYKLHTTLSSRSVRCIYIILYYNKRAKNSSEIFTKKYKIIKRYHKFNLLCNRQYINRIIESNYENFTQTISLKTSNVQPIPAIPTSSIHKHQSNKKPSSQSIESKCQSPLIPKCTWTARISGLISVNVSPTQFRTRQLHPLAQVHLDALMRVFLTALHQRPSAGSDVGVCHSKRIHCVG